MQNKKSGMTLIELIVVISVIALVAGVMIDQTASTIEIERIRGTQDNLNNISNAVRDFYRDMGQFPLQLAHLSSNTLPAGYTAPPAGYPGFRGPYLLPKFTSTVASDNEVLYDKWRTLYVYTNVSAVRRDIRSIGPDRTANNADDIVRSVLVTDIQTSVAEDLRTATRAEMNVINAAIANFYRRFPPPSSPTSIPPANNLNSYNGNWPAALQRLGAVNLLPNNAQYLTDQWGTAYNFDGAKVSTPNVP